jgi:hypothetical protein
LSGFAAGTVSLGSGEVIEPAVAVVSEGFIHTPLLRARLVAFLCRIAGRGNFVEKEKATKRTMSRGMGKCSLKETSMEPLVRSNFFLSKAEREGLQKLAHKQRISTAELIRRVIDAFLGIEAAPVEPIKFRSEVPCGKKR